MGAAPRRCLAQMSARPPWPWNFARRQKRPGYASWPSFGRGAENPCRSSRSQAQRTDNEAASRCPFASKTHCGSHATRARLPAPPTAALRSAGAAPHWFLACGPARTSGGAAPRAGTPRAAHHEPGARAPEGVRMQRLIAVAASAVGRETRRRAVNNVASMACGVGQRRRMASRRRRGAHTRA